MTIYEHDFLDPAPDASIISGVSYPGEESPNRIRRVYDSFVSPVSHAVFFFSASKTRDIVSCICDARGGYYEGRRWFGGGRQTVGL